MSITVVLPNPGAIPIGTVVSVGSGSWVYTLGGAPSLPVTSPLTVMSSGHTWTIAPTPSFMSTSRPHPYPYIHKRLLRGLKITPCFSCKSLPVVLVRNDKVSNFAKKKLGRGSHEKEPSYAISFCCLTGEFHDLSCECIGCRGLVWYSKISQLIEEWNRVQEVLFSELLAKKFVW